MVTARKPGSDEPDDFSVPVSPEVERILGKIDETFRVIGRPIPLPEVAVKPMTFPRLPREDNLASDFVARLDEKEQEERRALSPGEDLEVVAILPGGRELRVKFFGYWNPVMLWIRGIDSEDVECSVSTHYGNATILMRSVAKTQSPATRIGFQPQPPPEQSSGEAPTVAGESASGEP